MARHRHDPDVSLQDWLERRRLSGLGLIVVGGLVYFHPRGTAPGLGVLLVAFGAASLVLQRSTAPAGLRLRRVYQMMMLFSLSLAVWSVLGLKPPATWAGLVFSALGFAVSLSLLRSTKRATSGAVAQIGYESKTPMGLDKRRRVAACVRRVAFLRAAEGTTSARPRGTRSRAWRSLGGLGRSFHR